THDLVRDYAEFRAAVESQARPWREWQSSASGGDLSPDDVDPDVTRFYEYAQWVAHRQMSSAVTRTTDSPAGLYLDLPLGVHPDGYDAWRYRECFIPEASCGAPPDVLFTTGQDWGSPPPHPEAIRRRGYDYVRAILAHHMGSAAALRIDHVMGLHHIFCIPAGHTSAEGTYLRYHPDEMYAVISIESHRHRVSLVGEDLGTVPHEVRRDMRRHRLNRMFVLHYELEGMTGEHRLRVPQDCLVALNTHDMPPFASMWRGLDICQQADLGIVAKGDIDAAMRKRQQLRQSLLSLLPCSLNRESADVPDVLRCTLQWLGAQRARYVLVNLEDLWLETRQPNVPGVGAAYPSWRHRAAKSMEEIRNNVDVHSLLDIVRRARRGADGVPRERL
ncbi:MAG: 4-alpha-glucanotransferase, partial [Dehalococcoidia bacterium]|nr:4-alpha-glucanotransferase [Dehalococcoidia bacterium]